MISGRHSLKIYRAKHSCHGPHLLSQQRGGIDAGNDEASSPPTDLVRYLISLAELLVAWLSPPGPGPALSRRLLSSGANWALLRTLGRALRPASVCVCVCVCVCVYVCVGIIYKIARNRAIRPCHRNHSIPLGLFLRGGINVC